MRKIAFLAAVAATLCTVACNKEISTSKVENPSESVQMAELNLSIVGSSSPATKTLDADFDDEHSEVANIQFFVFDGEILDAYKKITSGLTTSITVKTGEKTVYAVVNAPDISSVKTLTELKAAKSSLVDNADHFVMVGSNTASVPSEDPIEIEVKRIVSRVVLKKITASFSNPAYAAMQCRLTTLMLLNVPTDINYELTDAPTEWVNKRVLGTGSVPDALVKSDLSSITADLNSAPFDTDSYFYSYPNPTVEDSQSTTWSARHTRLVVGVQLGSDYTVYYYPITLPVMEPGKSYEIENLTITRKGSDHPDTPVSLADATFEISVKPWTVVPVTEGITI